MVGVAGAVAQPSFDALTQRMIPLSAQGRAFARFGMRQQLVWVLGSLIPVVVSFTLPQGDASMAVLAALGGLSYATGRRAARAPRIVQRDFRDARVRLSSGRRAQPRRFSRASTWLGQRLGRKAIAELGVVLADERHLGPPPVFIDPQELVHVLLGHVEPVDVDRARRSGTHPIGVSSAPSAPSRSPGRRPTRARGSSRRNRARATCRPRPCGTS